MFGAALPNATFNCVQLKMPIYLWLNLHFLNKQQQQQFRTDTGSVHEVIRWIGLT